MEIRQSLESNFLICRICNKNFSEPKVLQCMHTFCKNCLEHIYEQQALDAAKKRRELEKQQACSSGYSSSSSSVSAYKGRWTRAFKNNGYEISNTHVKNKFSDDVITCPICEKRTTLPDSGVHGLQDDQLTGKLATIVGRIPKYPVCDVCSAGQSGLYVESPNVSEVTNMKNFHRPWTDVESGDNTSDFQTTEDDDEDDNTSEPQRQTFGFQSNILRMGRRNQKKTKPKSMNVSDDEAITQYASFPKNSMVEPNRAVVACLECSKQLCNFCHQNHTKFPVTADHVTVTLDQLASMSCPRHPRELRRFFCMTCGALICLVCTFESSIPDINSEESNEDSTTANGHADHEVFSIRNGLLNLQQSVNKLTFDCKQKADRLTLLLLGIRSCNASINSIKADINNTANELITQVNYQRQSLLKDLDNDVGVSTENLSTQCEFILSSLTSWNKVKNEGDFMEEIMNLHPVDALEEASLVRNRLLGCLDVLKSSIPKVDGWSKLVHEIDGLRHSSSGVTQPHQEDQTVYWEGVSEEKIGTPKHVRFAPPVEATDEFPPAHLAHWTRRLGKFVPGCKVELGRRATTGQLAAEAFEREEKHSTKAVQVSPTDVHGKPLPTEKDSRRHRAIQVNMLQANKEEVYVQTEPFILTSTAPLMKLIKADNGTQYRSSDVNLPMSLFRSSRQIMVQK